ncbi:transporter substrate-binding domain-containing protein [Pontitalea aquivivens]|uniref:transporter substrate-binding domain-containing protein n=1 Tax=Pontitalea aquivivens TaxID=3388663 RepID=UPI003970CDF6
MSKILRRLLAPVLATALAFATTAPAAHAQDSSWDRINESKVVRLGVAPYAPFSYKDALGTSGGGVKQGSDTWRGVAVMLGQEVAKSLGAEIEIVELSWAGAVAAIQTGQVDLFLGLDGTPQRAAAIEFIHTPVYKYGVVFFGREDLSVGNWADLDRPDVKLGVVNGTNFDSMLQKFAPNASIQRFPSTSEVLAAFQTGQIDGTIATPSASDTAKAKMNKGQVALLKDPAIYLPIVAAIPPQQDQRWRHFLETTFAYMTDVGTTQAIYQQELAASGIKPEDVSVEFIQ